MYENKFPTVTAILSTLMLGVFLFTHNNLAYYKTILAFYPSSLSFSPSNINLYSILTYTFLHVDYFHLFFNMVILIIAGLSVESRIGGWKFLAIFIVSAIFAAFFDVINRLLFDIPGSVPFVGASGAVFGLLFVASFLNPFEKIPFGIIFVVLIPFFGLIPSLGFFTEPIFLIFLTLVLIGLTSYGIRFSIPLIFLMTIFILTWLTSLFIKYPVDVSSFGHLGGALGGIISFLLLCWPKKANKAFR